MISVAEGRRRLIKILLTGIKDIINNHYPPFKTEDAILMHAKAIETLRQFHNENEV